MESFHPDLPEGEVQEDLLEEEGSPRGRAPQPRVYPHEIPIERIDPDAVKVIRRLVRNGHTAYLVGGGVRDLLLSRAPKDFDVATSARPREMRDLFRNCRVVGRRFLLAQILFGGGKVIEVATFRQDPTQALDFEDDGNGSEDSYGRREGDLLIRHDNVFGEPHDDAFRRDFTINGLFYDLERHVVLDYVGGWPDVSRRVIRTIGEPDVRFREDPIRVLRAVKFSARLDFGIDPEVYDAMVVCAPELRRSPPERVLEEILRLLRGGAGHRSTYLAWDIGALAVTIPELAAYLDDRAPGSEELWARLDAIDERKADDRLPGDAVLFAALLLGPISEALDGARDPSIAYEEFVEPIALRLKVPRRLKDRMRLLVLSQRRLRTGKIQAIMHREFFADAATLYAIDCEARGVKVPEWAANPVQSDEPPRDAGRRPRRRRRGGER